MFFFRTCRHAIELLPAMPRDDKDLDDVDTDAEDHIADEVRYRARNKAQAARQRSEIDPGKAAGPQRAHHVDPGEGLRQRAARGRDGCRQARAPGAARRHAVRGHRRRGGLADPRTDDSLESVTPLMTAVTTLGPSWLNPETMLTTFGDIAFWVVMGIIFAECGLLIGFFLPGDSLLFVTGLFIAQNFISMNIWLAAILLTISAILGNAVGYWIGKQAGPALFRKPDSKLFKREYVEKTAEFFEKYGARAIVMARFVPIVRTFITATAGMGRMDFRRFMIFSAIGAVLWAGGVTILGYFLGNIEFVKKNIEFILILVIAISLIPVFVEWIKHRRQRA